jgi:acylphosphatase
VALVGVVVLSDKACLCALVRGVVQGVCFRAFVRAQAEVLGLAGYVRNGDDGVSLEVVAEGSRDALEKLLEQLAKGPPAASVSAVDSEWREYGGLYRGFSVRH